MLKKSFLLLKNGYKRNLLKSSKFIFVLKVFSSMQTQSNMDNIVADPAENCDSFRTYYFF